MKNFLINCLMLAACIMPASAQILEPSFTLPARSHELSIGAGYKNGSINYGYGWTEKKEFNFRIINSFDGQGQTSYQAGLTFQLFNASQAELEQKHQAQNSLHAPASQPPTDDLPFTDKVTNELPQLDIERLKAVMLSAWSPNTPYIPAAKTDTGVLNADASAFQTTAAVPAQEKPTRADSLLQQMRYGLALTVAGRLTDQPLAKSGNDFVLPIGLEAGVTLPDIKLWDGMHCQSNFALGLVDAVRFVPFGGELEHLPLTWSMAFSRYWLPGTQLRLEHDIVQKMFSAGLALSWGGNQFVSFPQAP